MSEKLEVVYIGNKPQKRLTVLGRKYIFPRLKPVAIETDAAYHLLDIPSVFSTPDEVEKRVKQAEDSKAAEKKAKQEEQEAQKAEVKEQSYLVIVDGEQKDISKFTIGKLKAVIEAEELTVTTDRKSSADIRSEVRDALHAKHGNPEV